MQDIDWNFPLGSMPGKREGGEAGLCRGKKLAGMSTYSLTHGGLQS